MILLLCIRYHCFIVDYKKLKEENPGSPKLETNKPLFRRALYTIGLLLKHFDLKDETVRCGLQVRETMLIIRYNSYYWAEFYLV